MANGQPTSYQPNRRVVNQFDRDYELWEANAHPYQLMFYSFFNNLSKDIAESKALRDQGVEPLEDWIERVTQENIDAEEQATGRPVDRMRQVK